MMIYIYIYDGFYDDDNDDTRTIFECNQLSTRGDEVCRRMVVLVHASKSARMSPMLFL